jgi:hypothetical protein
MGYSHYLRQPKPFTDNQWKEFVEEVKQIFKNSDIPIGNAYGDVGSEPLITDINIAFNGIGEDSNETCMITKRVDKFSCCKTRCKPYDKVVVAVYKAARNHNSSIILTSDGGPEVFDDFIEPINTTGMYLWDGR